MLQPGRSLPVPLALPHPLLAEPKVGLKAQVPGVPHLRVHRWEG